MSILTIKDGVLEADFDQLIQRWSLNGNEIVGTSNSSNSCPIAVLFKTENPDIDFVDVRVDDCTFFKRGGHTCSSSALAAITRLCRGS